MTPDQLGPIPCAPEEHTCPRCKADVGEPCTMKREGRAHAPRIDKYFRARDRWLGRALQVLPDDVAHAAVRGAQADKQTMDLLTSLRARQQKARAMRWS